MENSATVSNPPPRQVPQPAPGTVTSPLSPEDRKRLSRYIAILVIVGTLIALAYLAVLFVIFLRPAARVLTEKTSDSSSMQDQDLWTTTYIVNTPNSTASAVVNPGIDYQVRLQPDSADASLTDVFLIDPKTLQEKLYLQLTDVYTQHIHPAEYHQGNVYIIHRKGAAAGVPVSPNWVDELWKYRADGKGRRLLANPGLDFRVSADNQVVAVVGSGVNGIVGENLFFLSGEGVEMQRYEPKDLGVDLLSAEGWVGSTFWISELQGAKLKQLVSLTLPDFDLAKYSVEDLSIGAEHALSPTQPKLLYSSYPVLFDAESLMRFESQHSTVSLQVTDLASKKSQVVATSNGKAFHPSWVDGTTVEFDNPAGSGRVQKKLLQ